TRFSRDWSSDVCSSDLFDVCRPQAVWPLDLDASRTLDVMCTITVRYGCEAISWHRQQALQQLSGLRHLRVFLGRGRVLPLPTYRSEERRGGKGWRLRGA